jgi:hypothetical protein
MSEILINTTTTGSQLRPAVAALRDAGFLVVWADTSDLTIKGRIILANGNPGGDEFVVNTPTPPGANTDRDRPTISSSASGPIVAWIEKGLNFPPPYPHVKLQRFNLDGQKSGPEIQVSTTHVDPNHRPAIAGMIDGGFLVTWMDARWDRRVRAQRFSIDGSKAGDEFQVNTADGFHESPIVTRLLDGNYVIAWRSDPSPSGGGALTFRIFDLEGSPVVGEIKPNLFGFRGDKAMTFLDNGRFVIAHVRHNGASGIGVSKGNVVANIFEANGDAAFPIFVTREEGINCSKLAIAPLLDGRFLVAWVQKSAETFSTSPSVRARVFSDRLGDAVGQEVEVNIPTAGNLINRVCAATIVSSGEPEVAFVAWADHRRDDPSEFEVRGRVLPIFASGGLG